MVQTWTDVDAHGPNFLILRITIRVHRRLWVATSFTAAVVSTARGSTTTGPVDPSHVEVHVVGHLNVRVVFFDPVIGPEITSSLSSFFTRPKAENHRVAGVEIRHRFGNGEHHSGSCRVVVGPNSCSVGSTENVRVEHAAVDRRRDVKVSTKHHPLVWVDFAKPVATDVVGFGILCSCHERIIGEALRDDLKAETFQVADEVLCSVFVSCISLSGPPVEVADGTVSSVR